MVYIGIIWNTVNTFKNEIIEDINMFGTVLRYYEIELGENYDKFVRKIYEYDGIAEWKVDLKLKAMNDSDNTNIVVIFIQIDDLKKEYNEKKKKEVIVSIENLKDYIRSKYCEKIPNYYFDNTFHMTDNEQELASTLIVLREFLYNEYDDYKNNYCDKNKMLVRKKEYNENK